MTSKFLMALAGSGVLAASASGAAYSFAPFNATVGDTLNTTAIGSAPSGSWNYFKISADWAAVSGGPWSTEAEGGLWSVNDAQYLNPEFYAQYGAANDSNSTMLRWGGALAISLAGGEPLEFDALQDYTGSVAQWDNITITLQTSPDALLPAGAAIAGPSSTDLGVQGMEGASFTIDSLGSDFDTELGLYNQAGELLVANDDFGTLQSLIDPTYYDGATDTIYGGFSAGTYYVALGGYNTSFGDTAFSVTGGSASGNYDLALAGTSVSSGTLASGEIHWFSFTIVPAPSAAGFLAMGGLFASRRRR